MSTTTIPLLVVVGATGNQGSSVIRTFQSDAPSWRIRGLTRNTDTASSRSLASTGVEMVQANLDDPASLTTAFADATAIFAVTDFWGPFSNPQNQEKAKKEGKIINVWAYDYEVRQAKNIFAAAAEVKGLQRFVFSSLSNAKKWSHGKYQWVYHFDGKTDAVEYGKEHYPALWAKTSIILVGGYLSNFSTGGFFMPKKVSRRRR